ncbi:hypothetical protein ACSO1_06810 [Acinetobacter calcoaceticus]|nr:hypothetical protein ACSO1_06810 [Acinetobacter calcoaceticus]
MNAQFKPHPDGVKAYIGHDRLTGLYSVLAGLFMQQMQTAVCCTP